MDTTLRTGQLALDEEGIWQLGDGGPPSAAAVVRPAGVQHGPRCLLVACGGDSVPAGIPDSSVPDALPGTPAEVKKAILTNDDLGEGWTDLGAIPVDERDFAQCPETGPSPEAAARAGVGAERQPV